ncbi:C-X-C motif chemokine 15-like [Alexandromys fortis]|uniref:C-X-C motif chemokine 15-like n=1 Tax=Alexandromys fortis TaxID=100897 RepID=UPI00215256E1|nr:C-X-C motif chemokine 15-like [Microtus fortis]
MVAKGWLPFLLVALYLGIFDHPCETQELRCLCIQLCSDFIPRSLTKYVWVIPENIYCDRMEVIVMLKNGTLICLDPDAVWVKRLTGNIMQSPHLRPAQETEYLLQNELYLHHRLENAHYLAFS